MKRKIKKTLVVLCGSASLLLFAWFHYTIRLVSPEELRSLQCAIRLKEKRERVLEVHLPQEDNMTTELRMPLQLAKESPYDAREKLPLKKILMWNEFYDMKHLEFGLGREPFVRAGCPVNTCWLTANKSLFPHDKLDALIWHAASWDTSFPPQRSLHTRYIFFALEPPPILDRFNVDLRPYSNTFNWTMTYRLDSDVPYPYGYVLKRRARDHSWEGIDFAAGKTKMAAWLVSNCRVPSGRERVVKTLQQWMPIDVYGRCGTMACGPSRDWRCYDMLNRVYKFYFALENCFCKDYVTEKLYFMLDMNVIPVVYGGAEYKHLLPPDSYIDVLDFPNLKDLAEYLHYLHKNDSAFNGFFKWKRDYLVLNWWAGRARAFCKLCERLHSDKRVKVYQDIHDWFITQAQCTAL